MKRHTFMAMRTSSDDLPVGSVEWCTGISSKLQYTYDHAERMGVERLVAVLRPIVDNKPWMQFPKAKPSKRADVYFESVTGEPWSVLVAMIDHKDHELAMQIQAEVNPASGNQYTVDHDNVMKQPKQGNSKAYTLNRLKRENTELFNRVVAGEMSANAAAIEAGFRKVPTGYEKLVKAWEKASEDERQQFMRDYK